MSAVPTTRAARLVVAPDEPPHFIETWFGVFRPLDDGSAVTVAAHTSLELADASQGDQIAGNKRGQSSKRGQLSTLDITIE